MNNPANKLIRHYGGIKEAAQAIGCNYESMRRWAKIGIPLERSVHVERMSNGVVNASAIVRFWRYKKNGDAKK